MRFKDSIPVLIKLEKWTISTLIELNPCQIGRIKYCQRFQIVSSTVPNLAPRVCKRMPFILGKTLPLFSNNFEYGARKKLRSPHHLLVVSGQWPARHPPDIASSVEADGPARSCLAMAGGSLSLRRGGRVRCNVLKASWYMSNIRGGTRFADFRGCYVRERMSDI